jgi:hypothetical protein
MDVDDRRTEYPTPSRPLLFVVAMVGLNLRPELLR